MEGLLKPRFQTMHITFALFCFIRLEANSRVRIERNFKVEGQRQGVRKILVIIVNWRDQCAASCGICCAWDIGSCLVHLMGQADSSVLPGEMIKQEL